jgi:hypothetical protein
MAGRGLSAVALSLCLLAASVNAEENADLARAEELMESLRYADAAKALDAARAKVGNDRPTLLRILELQGIVAASLGRVAEARAAFRLLLSLEPQYSLKGKYSPKVTAPYYEAKGWAVENGTLRFEEVPPVTVGDTVEALAARVVTDPLKAGQSVRFYVREGPGEPRVVDAPLEGGVARTQVKGNPVSWWAELLGERSEVLALLGSAEAPRVARVGGAPIVKQPDAPVAETPAVAAAAGAPKDRTLAYVGLGGAAVSLGTGVFFGIQSLSAQGKLDGAERDALGRITGMTQRDALVLHESARNSALAANVLFGVGAGLAVAGGVLWLSSGDSAPAVAVVPTHNGVSISGVLP